MNDIRTHARAIAWTIGTLSALVLALPLKIFVGLVVATLGVAIGALAHGGKTRK